MIEIKDIGQLRERVVFYSQTVTRDTTTGEPKQSFTIIGTYWAEVQFTGGSETVGGDIAYDVSRISVIIKYNTSINDNSIANWNDRNYNIISIEFDPQRMFMKLVCESAK